MILSALCTKEFVTSEHIIYRTQKFHRKHEKHSFEPLFKELSLQEVLDLKNNKHKDHLENGCPWIAPILRGKGHMN